MKKIICSWFLAGILLFVVIGAVHAEVFTYTDETSYLNALVNLGYSTFQEGFENDAAWGSVRTTNPFSPNTALSITSMGITWTHNHPEATTEPPHVTTGGDIARTGLWGFYALPHGNPDRDTDPEICDVNNPPASCLQHDGFVGTREPAADTLYGVGGWFQSSTGANLVMILDGDEVNPVELGNLSTPFYQFFGMIETLGFTQFEVRETDGKSGQPRTFFADDFTFGILGGPCVPTGLSDETCDNIDDDCDEQIDDDYVVDDTCGIGECQANNNPSSCIDGVETPCVPADATAEICTGSLDEDCDDLIDCLDPDCVADPACAECQTDADCAAGEVCEGGTCVGSCPEGETCDDQDPCTVGDICGPNNNCIPGSTVVCNTPGDCEELPGICVGGTCEYAAVVCDTPNAALCETGPGTCTNDVCTYLACGPGEACEGGTCIASCPESDPCDDGDPCTMNDTCGANNDCISGAQMVCNTPGDCEELPGTCVGGTCEYAAVVCDTPNAALCETGTGTCANNVCTYTACGPGEVCEGGTCVTSAGCTIDADCADDEFCNGDETCVAGNCQAGTDPCPGQECVEVSDSCVDCLTDSDCGSGEFCEDGTCVTPAECESDADCDDDEFCNGEETCDDGTCQEGTDPCDEGEICDEESDECIEPEPEEVCDCSDPNAILGTPGDDDLKGTSRDDIICGFGGNDTIAGGSGKDCIDGGPGEDYIKGGSGKDVIGGGSGNDIIKGGSGKDVIDGGPDDDKIKGGSGKDVIDGGPGDDKIKGGSGKDDIDGGEGFDTINGGSGKDVCVNGPVIKNCEIVPAGQDFDEAGDTCDCSDPKAILGTPGDDDLKGNSGNDIICAFGGNDTISGGSGKDCIDGGPGEDDIKGGSGKDTIDGGEGFDSINGGSGKDECVNGEEIKSCESP